ncbi:protein VAPYRIN-like [Branchiostoma floridae]|uniref:Protein VAPYRIN-like n=1 Tax=Branchiostoma floridae TaxID=7739 RepID=A0A9J7LT19_BRAFL|nr:protein VAPYRIN-like [Branchiostoma floridae]
MDFKDRYDCTPLHYAAYEGDNDAIRLLLNRGAEFHEQNTYRQTVLHIAAFHGHNDTVKLWLDHGVDIAAVDNMCRATLDENCSGNTALHAAIPHGGLKTVTHLLGLGVEVNARNKDGKDGGWTALDHALHWGDFTIAEALLLAGADCNMEIDEEPTPVPGRLFQSHADQFFPAPTLDVGSAFLLILYRLGEGLLDALQLLQT